MTPNFAPGGADMAISRAPRRGSHPGRPAQLPGGMTGHRRVWRYVPRHHAPRAHDGTLADGDAAQDHRAAADRGTPLDTGGDDRPVGLGLRRAVGVHRRRMAVVDEDDVMP